MLLFSTTSMEIISNRSENNIILLILVVSCLLGPINTNSTVCVVTSCSYIKEKRSRWLRSSRFQYLMVDITYESCICMYSFPLLFLFFYVHMCMYKQRCSYPFYFLRYSWPKSFVMITVRLFIVYQSFVIPFASAW